MIAALQAAWAGMAPNARGMTWAFLGSLFMALTAVLVKYLGNELNSFEVAFFRALFGFLAIAPFVLRPGAGGIRTTRPGLHTLRGVMGAAAMLSGFYAVTVLPLALATSLSFSRSLFMIVLATLFLGEVVRARRWTATILGIVGVIVMLRPTTAIDSAAFYSLFSAFMVAAVMVATKKLATTEPPVRIIFYAGFFGTLIALAPAIFLWETPSFQELALMVLLGIVGALGTNCMVRALAAGEATVVAPVEYVRIIFAALFGFFLFSETPDIWTGVGAVIIVGSTLYIALREARLGKPKPDPIAEA